MNERFQLVARQFALLLFVSIVCGCFGPSAPKRPGFDPAASAKEALATYDSNSDGAIDKTEVEACPGLKAAFASIDTDGNDQLASEEIEARVRYYKSAPTIVVQGQTRVIYKGRPLEGARVLMEPESILGADFKPCEGTTDEYGLASLNANDSNLPGIYLGFYTVRITKDSKGRELLPKKYNEETTLGYEATDDQNEGLAEIITFTLK